MPANYSAGVFEQSCLGDSGEVSLAPAIKPTPHPDPRPYQTRSQWVYMAAQPFIRASHQHLPLTQLRPLRLAQPSAVSETATPSPEPASAPEILQA